MHGSAQPEDRFPAASAADTIAPTDQASAVGAVADRLNGTRVLEETELNSALQLLVERAQYITGATGTALALPQGEEMVCRASAGSSAPAVGARLQVRSGLTGESIARRQLLRCDNAEADPRVNLDACRALGIASIVVLPLLRHTGEVRGLFELFSDHPYAFEERDLIALERMAALTLTALDLAEQRQSSSHSPAPAAGREPEKPVESPAASSAPPPPATPLQPEFAGPAVASGASTAGSLPQPEPEPTEASVPEALLRVQKCASCGFPVSDGRTLCLDCEKKDKDTEKMRPGSEPGQIEQPKIDRQKQKIDRQTTDQQQSGQQNLQTDDEGESLPPAQPPVAEEFVPAFLRNAVPMKESWLGNHVNLLAIAVLILGILVAIVVFR